MQMLREKRNGFQDSMVAVELACIAAANPSAAATRVAALRAVPTAAFTAAAPAGTRCLVHRAPAPYQLPSSSQPTAYLL